MLIGRPLYDTDADLRWFVEPPDWPVLQRAVLRKRFNVMVTGGRGIGKTSLLRQLQRWIRVEGQAVSFVEASAVDTGAELVSRIRSVVIGREPSMSEQAAAIGAQLSARALPPGGASRGMYADLEAIGGADPMIVLVDASGSAGAVYEVFGRMRDTLWQGPHTWVVAVDEAERGTALAPPADAFFDVVVVLQPWEPGPLLELLSRRAPELPRAVLGSIAESARGNPRAALRVTSGAIVGGDSPQEHLVAQGVLLDRASALGRPHAMLFTEVVARGQAGPSDQDLQTTLGVTRARLATLFRELQEAGLVTSDVVRADGPGRPRSVYRPAST